jgi:hypothetical protein
MLVGLECPLWLAAQLPAKSAYAVLALPAHCLKARTFVQGVAAVATLLPV